MSPTATLNRHEHRLAVTAGGRQSSFYWAAGIVLTSVVVLVGAILWRNDGHFTYVVDDPAIHLAVARDLALHGTWGVSPHEFQSASSSPLWTILLALFAWLPLGIYEWVPLVLNVAACLWLAHMLVNCTTLLRPSTRRWMDVAALIVLLLGVLFLPGLTTVGMEHTLQIALLWYALLSFQHWLDGEDAGGWGKGLIGLFLAAATRFETAFVACGFGVGLLLLSTARLGPVPRLAFLRQLPRAVAVWVAALVPLGIYAIVNLSFGQDPLPNSVVAKSALGGGTSSIHVTVFGTLEAIDRDPLVLLGFILALAYLVFAWFGGPRRYVALATTNAIAIVLHSAFASYGWFERYQAYLIGISVLFILLAAAECVSERFLRAVPASLVIFGILLAPTKWDLLRQVPLAAHNTYAQRYQAALFVQRYYKGQPVATGELGYIALLHDGPLFDVLGLGNYDVLKARREHRDTPQFYESEIKRHGSKIVIVYPLSIFYNTPPQWTLVGEMTISEKTLTAFQPMLQFWAPTASDVNRIHAQLLQFSKQLPSGTTLTINKFLDIQKRQVIAKYGEH